MKNSYYFKTKEDVVRYGISPNLIYEDDLQCIPISAEEYNTAIAEVEAKNKDKSNIEETITPTYEDLVETNMILEAENAALLYQVLTGEELTDV